MVVQLVELLHRCWEDDPEVAGLAAKTLFNFLMHWQGDTSVSQKPRFTAEQCVNLLEVLEDRHGRRSTIATSQLPIEEWHGVIGDATLADAILDRLVHNAYKINLRGESMRKQQAKLTGTETSE